MTTQVIVHDEPISISGGPTPKEPAPIEHTKRTYQSFPGANYVLPSNAPERESSTGSGSWLLDVLSTVSKATEIHSLDIETHLFPSSDDRVIERGNVEFHAGTITKLPKQWSNKSSLVHQRLLVAALQASEWKQAIVEMFHVLVPGSWVQLREVGEWHAGAVTEKHISLVQMLFKAKGLLLDCSMHIPEILHKVGFVNVTVETQSIPLSKWAEAVGVNVQDNFMGVFRGMKTPVLNAGGLGFVTTKAEWDGFVEKEWDDTPGTEIQFNIFYMMKPTL